MPHCFRVCLRNFESSCYPVSRPQHAGTVLLLVTLPACEPRCEDPVGEWHILAETGPALADEPSGLPACPAGALEGRLRIVDVGQQLSAPGEWPATHELISVGLGEWTDADIFAIGYAPAVCTVQVRVSWAPPGTESAIMSFRWWQGGGGGPVLQTSPAVVPTIEYQFQDGSACKSELISGSITRE